jgi:two-component system, NarL family, sensor histidine kinase UhpB
MGNPAHSGTDFRTVRALHFCVRVTDDPQHTGGARSGLPEVGLYARVFAVNAFLLVLAALLLVVTPIRIDPHVTASEFAIILVGLICMLVANALLLRLSLAPLRRLTELMRTVDVLRPGVRLRASGSTEIAEVITAFNSTLDRLERERRDSTRRVITAQEAERRRIAQELHDQIGQNLTAVMLELNRAQRLAGPDAADMLADAQEIARESLDDLHRISYELRPAVLDDLGLPSALETLCRSMSSRTGIDIRFQPAGAPAGLDPQEELAIYRVAQEALTNAVRHSECSSVTVSLVSNAGGVTLSVRDNGTGIGQGGAPVSGIRGMRERAVMIGAQLAFDDRPGEGCEVTLELPAGTGAGE